MSNKKVRLLLLVGLLILLTACGKKLPLEPGDQLKQVVMDDFANEIELGQPRKRIISLSPSSTEILFALGLDEEIVGVSSFSDYPKAALDKEIIGGFGEPNMEKIIGLAPDIVISSGEENLQSKELLKNAGIEMATFNSGTIDDVMEEIQRIGLITGREQEAEILVGQMEKDLKQILDKVEKLPTRKKVFYEVWGDPLTTAGPGSFIDDLIQMAGGENIASSMDQAYPEFSLESLIDENPEIYLSTDDGTGKTKEAIISRPGYGNIQAIEKGQVYMLDANILSRPGPRIVEALEILYETINQEGEE